MAKHVDDEILSKVNERWSAILEAQGQDPEGLVSGDDCADPIQAVAIVTGIPVELTNNMIGTNTLSMLGRQPESQEDVVFARALNGAGLRFLLLGWLIRDEQQLAQENEGADQADG